MSFFPSGPYQPGNRLYDCERCGLTYRFNEMRREQTKGSKNLIVCPDCYDGPHPRDEKIPYRPEGKLERIE